MIFKRININSLDENMIKKYYPMLSESRKQKIAEMKDPGDRAVLLCGEMLARQCLSELLDAPEFSFQLLCNVNSKSVVLNYNANICIASFGEVVVCAAAISNVGVCILPVRPFSFAEAQALLSDGELRTVYSYSVYSFAELVSKPSCAEEDVTMLFAVYSTLKEAYYRATGRGFKSDINKTEFHFEDPVMVCSDSAYAVPYAVIDTAESVAISVVERII